LARAIILSLFYIYSSLIALKLRRSGPGAFLIDYENKASLMTYSVISSIPSFKGIIGSGLSFSYGVGKAVARNRASFCSKVVAISSFGPLTVGVVDRALGEVYRRAVQHLFWSSI
jgi:hypothetical protein